MEGEPGRAEKTSTLWESGSGAMLIAAIFSTLLQTGYQYLLLNMARGKKAELKDLIYPFQTMPDHVILLAVDCSF